MPEQRRQDHDRHWYPGRQPQGEKDYRLFHGILTFTVLDFHH